MFFTFAEVLPSSPHSIVSFLKQVWSDAQCWHPKAGAPILFWTGLQDSRDILCAFIGEHYVHVNATYVDVRCVAPYPSLLSSQENVSGEDDDDTWWMEAPVLESPSEKPHWTAWTTVHPLSSVLFTAWPLKGHQVLCFAKDCTITGPYIVIKMTGFYRISHLTKHQSKQLGLR